MKTDVVQLKKPQERIPVGLAYPECFHESLQLIRRKEVSNEMFSLICFCKSFCPVCQKIVNNFLRIETLTLPSTVIPFFNNKMYLQILQML